MAHSVTVVVDDAIFLESCNSTARNYITTAASLEIRRSDHSCRGSITPLRNLQKHLNIFVRQDIILSAAESWCRQIWWREPSWSISICQWFSHERCHCAKTRRISWNEKWSTCATCKAAYRQNCPVVICLPLHANKTGVIRRQQVTVDWKVAGEAKILTTEIGLGSAMAKNGDYNVDASWSR